MKDVFSNIDAKLENVINNAERVVTNQAEKIKNSANVQKENLQNYADSFKESIQKKQTQKELYNKKDGYYSGGMAMFVVGIVFVVLVAIAMLVLLILSNIPFLGGAFTCVNRIILVPILAIFTILMIAGNLMTKRVKRFKNYQQTIGSEQQVEINNLAHSINKSVGYTRRDLRSMIAATWFKQARLTNDGQILFVTLEAFKDYQDQLQQAREDEAISAIRKQHQDSMSADVRLTVQTGAKFITELQEYQIKITAANMSSKLSRLERTLKKIFSRVEAHPEVVPQLRKMVDYYLPTTMKLLNAYVQLNKQDIQGPNIVATKTEIEDSLDTLLIAYERQLDDLFADVALDVETDITVLNTMLVQDGLVDSELDIMRGSE